jgi:DNA mismatch repair protein MutL
VLHVTLPADVVDVNVHPAKTEVKFLNEKAVFDCVHYGVLGALNKTPDRPAMQLKSQPVTPAVQPAASATAAKPVTPVPSAKPAATKQESFFRTMNPTEFKAFTSALTDAPQPKQEAAVATVSKLEQPVAVPVREPVIIPGIAPTVAPSAPVSKPVVQVKEPEQPVVETEQTQLDMPEVPQWRMVGELYRSYIIVEEGDNAFLIDKHAAHERILFDKLKSNQEAISSQYLLTPVPVRLSPEAAAELLSNQDMLTELGFEIDEFGENTLLLRQIPMDLSPDGAAEALETIAHDLLIGRRESRDSVRDEVLHTVACKAAIKAGWNSDDRELLALVKEVMSREDLKYCPHGRPICITLSKKQLEKQFKRS